MEYARAGRFDIAGEGLAIVPRPRVCVVAHALRVCADDRDGFLGWAGVPSLHAEADRDRPVRMGDWLLHQPHAPRRGRRFLREATVEETQAAMTR